MPYYPNKNILFIHIPKTGGTVIENQIKKQYNQTLYSGKTNNILEYPYNKISLQHQFYTTIYKYKNILNINFNNIKIFSVVRNPYDRIISDLFWFNFITKDDSSDKVYNIIKNNYLYRDDLDNHNLPQYLFITDENKKLLPNIKIFKTEELNIKDNELNNFLNININIKRENVNKNYSKYLNRKSINIINNFYKKDFKLFGYNTI